MIEPFHAAVTYIHARIIYVMLQLQVKKRTASDNSAYGSHVMQYGDIGLGKNDLFLYMGTNPENDNYTFVDDNSLRPPSKAVNQRDADLIHIWAKVCVQSLSVHVEASDACSKHEVNA